MIKPIYSLFAVVLFTMLGGLFHSSFATAGATRVRDNHWQANQTMKKGIVIKEKLQVKDSSGTVFFKADFDSNFVAADSIRAITDSTGITIESTAGTDLIFFDAENTRIGVGTTSPDNLFNIQDTGGNADADYLIKLEATGTNTARNMLWVVGDDSNTGITNAAGPNILLQNQNTTTNNMSVVKFTESNGSLVSALVSRNVSHDTTTASGAIALVTVLSGSAQQSVYVTAGGDLIVGTSTSTSYAIEAENGAVAGAGAYVNTSDKRLKKTTETVAGACDIVDSLSPVLYHWKSADETEDLTGITGGRDFAKINSLPGGIKDIGFLAQDVESSFPQAISKDHKGLYSLSYSKFIPLMLACIKEMRTP